MTRSLFRFPTTSPAFIDSISLSTRALPLMHPSKRHADPPLSPAPKRTRIGVRQTASSIPPSQNDSTIPTPHAIVNTFDPKPFHPFLSTNPHFQTIIPHFYPVPPPISFSRVLLHTDDGEAVVHVDVAGGNNLGPDGPPPTQPIAVPPPASALSDPPDLSSRLPSTSVAVVLPGLESNSRDIKSSRITHSLLDNGFKVVIMNHRSCAGPEDKQSTLRLYHAAFTEDVDTLIRVIRHAALQAGRRPPDVYLCGFSLGANITLHFLSRPDVTSLYGVVAGAAACVPFDPAACQRELDSGWKGIVYSSRLVNTMQQKFRDIAERGGQVDVVDEEAMRKVDRIGLIDDTFISPVFGFRDRFDYYAHVDARAILRDISVPTLIINASDDPFFDHSDGTSLPTAAQLGESPVRLVVLAHGGHCGFLDAQTLREPKSGFFQREFGRWFKHVRSSRMTGFAAGGTECESQAGTQTVSVEDSNTAAGSKSSKRTSSEQEYP